MSVFNDYNKLMKLLPMVWRTTITIIPDLVVPTRNWEVIRVITHESFTGGTHQDFPRWFRRSLHWYRVTLHFSDVATVTEVVVGGKFGGARFVVPGASWISGVMSVHPIWPTWSAYWRIQRTVIITYSMTLSSTKHLI